MRSLLPVDNPDLGLDGTLRGEGDAHQDQTLELDARAIPSGQRCALCLGLLLSTQVASALRTSRQGGRVTVSAFTSLAV